LEQKSKDDRARIASLEARLLDLSPPKQILIGISQNSTENHEPIPIFVAANCDLSEFYHNVLFCDAFFVDSLKSLKQVSEIQLRYISHCELILDSSTNILFPGCLRLDETLTNLDMEDSEKKQLKDAFDLAGVKLMHNDVSLF